MPLRVFSIASGGSRSDIHLNTSTGQISVHDSGQYQDDRYPLSSDSLLNFTSKPVSERFKQPKFRPEKFSDKY